MEAKKQLLVILCMECGTEFYAIKKPNKILYCEECGRPIQTEPIKQDISLGRFLLGVALPFACTFFVVLMLWAWFISSLR